MCRVGLTKDRDLRDDELVPLRVCTCTCLPLPGVSYHDILVRREEETQGGDVSTMRVFLVVDRYITIRAPLNFACSMQAVLEFA